VANTYRLPLENAEHPGTEYFSFNMQKNPPVEWTREWALASEEFEDYPLGPHTKYELRTLILEAIIAKD
jgi:hypothetical protein